MIDCSNLNLIAPPTSLIEDCDQPSHGVLRMATRFAYPNGDQIDVFLEHRPGLLERFVLSDCGQTLMYLTQAQCKIDSTPKRKQMLDGICQELGVRFSDGHLLLELESSTNDLTDHIVRLSQACIRVSDFALHASRSPCCGNRIRCCEEKKKAKESYCRTQYHLI